MKNCTKKSNAVDVDGFRVHLKHPALSERIVSVEVADSKSMPVPAAIVRSIPAVVEALYKH